MRTINLLDPAELAAAAQAALTLTTPSRLGVIGAAAGFLSIAAQAPTPFGAMQALSAASLQQSLDAARALTNVGTAAATLDQLETALSVVQEWTDAGVAAPGSDVANALISARLAVTVERLTTAAVVA